MLYQLNYIHHQWDCKGSVFYLNCANFSFEKKSRSQERLFFSNRITYSDYSTPARRL